MSRRTALAALMATAVSAAAVAPASAQAPNCITLPLLGQVCAPTLPTDPAALAGVLASLTPQQLSLLTPQQVTDALAAANGLTPAQAAALLPQVTAALASGNPAQLAALAGSLGAPAPAAPGGGTSPNSGASSTPTTTAAPSQPGTAAPRTIPVRASIARLTVAKNRRSATAVIACPASAPVCFVVVSGRLAGKKAFKPAKLALAPGASAQPKLTLKPGVARTLARKGGALDVTAVTSFSSLGAATKRVSVARPR